MCNGIRSKFRCCRRNGNDNTSGTNFTASYPNGQWFELKFVIDLSMNNWEAILVDNESQGSFANTINQISSIDFFQMQQLSFGLMMSVLITNLQF